MADNTHRQKRLEYNRPSFKKMLSENLPHECRVCGCTDESKLIYHHIVPLSLGGENNLRNIIVLCAECHSKTHMVPNAWNNSGAGRPTKFPSNYKEILEKYIDGDIGRSECEKALNMAGGSHIHDKPLYKAYLAEKGIAKVRNLIDVRKYKSNEIKQGALIVQVTYLDGVTKEIYYTGHGYKKIIYNKAI